MKKLTGDYSKEKLVRVLCLVTADAVIVNLAAVVTLLIRFSIDGMTVWNSAFEWYLKLYLGYAVINTVVTIVMFALFNLYNSLWEFAGYNELVRIGCASVASALVNFVLMMVIEDSRMPLSFPIVYSMLLAAGTGTLRLIYRALRRKRSGRSTAEKKRTMLIGGGQAGAMVLREFRYSAHSENKVVCVIDDDRSKWGSFIQGVKIVGGKESIVSAAEKYNVEEIILAIPSASRRQKLDILEICHATGCKLRTLPGLYQLANGEVSIQKIREVDIEDLLGRDIVKIDLNEVAGYIKDKVVLVTGGGGSIGSELCRQAATQKPKTLIIFDIYENNAYEIQMELRRQHP